MITSEKRGYRRYPSSQEDTLALYANFRPAAEPRPLLLSLHGWHGTAKRAHSDDVKPPVAGEWFVVEPDLRGRGDSTGQPDANGWELQDAVDAVDFARREFADLISDPERVRVHGGSGGGGNVLGLLGKFPDFFSAAVCECGISDYAAWFQSDTRGEFRDEMKDRGWIGGTLEDNPEAYASRGGLTTVSNLLTPLLLTHGVLDTRCPVEQTRRYLHRAQSLGLSDRVRSLEFEGVGAKGGHWGEITEAQEAERARCVSEHLTGNRPEVILPSAGSFVIAGYLKTRSFEVIFDSPDRIGSVTYDLPNRYFDIRSPSARQAKLRVREGDNWTEKTVICNPEPRT